MKYQVIGDVPAPTFFGINEDTGRIFVKSNLKADDEVDYRVCKWHLVYFNFTLLIYHNNCKRDFHMLYIY